jgi:tRNA (guanine-N(7)-)-methyltransferase subunit TRM82
VDGSNTHIATVSDDKKLKVWTVEGLELLSERYTHSKSQMAKVLIALYQRAAKETHGCSVHERGPDDTCVGQIRRRLQVLQVSAITIALNLTEIESYPLHPATATPNTGPSKDPLASHENPWGNLVLGHVSLLTAFLLSHDERYIVTADRDEHIRISWYPEGYNIEIYCLGHEK